MVEYIQVALAPKRVWDPLIIFQNLSFNNEKDQSVKIDKN